MEKIFVAPIVLAFICEDQSGGPEDFVSELMRPLTQQFGDGPLLDWSYASIIGKQPDGTDYAMPLPLDADADDGSMQEEGAAILYAYATNALPPLNFNKSLADHYFMQGYKSGKKELLEDMKHGRSDFHLMLDLSTAHLTYATASFVADTGIQLPMRWISHVYGFVFWPTEPSEDQDWSEAPELEAINKFAYESGCMLVNFDQDADKSERFPTYEW